MGQIIDITENIVIKSREWDISGNKGYDKLPHTTENQKDNRMPKADAQKMCSDNQIIAANICIFFVLSCFQLFREIAVRSQADR